MLSLVVQGCVTRGQLGSTTCHRMQMATLLPLPASLLALAKVAGSSCSIAGAAVVAGLQLASFAVHVLLHLTHHPWFFVKVFWPIAVTMLITEVVPTDWTFADGSGAAPVQAALAAVLSVKVISKVPRLAAKFAPKLGKRWLLPIINWLARHVLPRIAAALARVLPRLARHVGKLIPKLTRFGTHLAGRMAPRYAQDQLVGTTQKMAFPSADGLLTDTVARCIDLLPPRNAASWCYMALLAVQLLMTAADRGHLWKPANRQLNLALGVLQAGMAVVLLLAMEAGAVLPGCNREQAQTCADVTVSEEAGMFDPRVANH
ncbi:hypothetical protein OEZ85_010947 [Tetradesmus obliquus]|uniref:Uncharacterized protein n=1 Tax=Tetradesmus obliquus TaxID=3088 RepID=A0ABY8TQX0_TETOB|nr:hypothetical protein OEZ85_010947 [Tetradesmus obliquus]